ncbi:hypothetical protein [Aeromonas aquatica]|uniref:hypothetical protein n=1 Tax=Aeromonas aquatica TaxID=558964 RepID=UPI00286EC086|nr:hypothetical protein [Aeromonas aquatica]
MTISNIDRFDTTVVLALAELYSSFPVRQDLLASAFILTEEGEHIEGILEQDERYLGPEDLYHKRKEFAFYSLHWLLEAGYMHGSPYRQDAIEDAVLTAKGLEVLKATPDSLQGTLGERLQEVAKNGAGAAASALVGKMVGLGLNLLG